MQDFVIVYDRMDQLIKQNFKGKEKLHYTDVQLMLFAYEELRHEDAEEVSELTGVNKKFCEIFFEVLRENQQE